MKFSTAAARVSYKAASDIAGKAAMFAILLLAARLLTTSAFGLFSVASTLGWLFAVATDLGLQLHLAREVARSPQRLASILGPMMRFRLSLAVTAVALTCTSFFWLQPIEAFAFVLIAAAYVVSGLVEFLNYLYRAIGRSELESTLNLLQRLASLAGVLLFLRVSPSLVVLGAALFVPPLMTLAWSIRLVEGIARGTTVSSADVGSAFSASTFVRDVLPIGAGIVLSALYFRVDLFLVQRWRGIDEVATYNAVFRLIDALRLFPAALLTVLLPAVFRRRDAFFTWTLSIALAAFGLCVGAVLYAGAPQIISLTYGDKYTSAVPVLKVLSLAFPALCLNYGLTHQVIGWARARVYAIVCGLALVFNVAINLVLIPSAGSVGAAWTTLWTEVALTGVWVAVLWKARGAG